MKHQRKQSISVDLKLIDDTLYSAVSDIDILAAITPSNYQQEKARFFDSGCNVTPELIYHQNQIDLFAKKRELFNLPIEKIKNKQLYQLYSEVIEAYVDKLDQFRHIGSPEFLYDSLRYYGEPSLKELNNANYLLHVTNSQVEEQDALVGAQDIAAFFTVFAEGNNYPLELVISDDLIANALVSGSKVTINKNAQLSKKQMKALAHHELGVHLATTLNAKNQPLKILQLGSPVNTTTQEGLAILCEYLAGFMTFDRLRTLALRVLAVNSMIVEKDFKRTYAMLAEQHGVEKNKAFTICARVYRGGGFTKDYLYLKGFQQVLSAFDDKQDLKNLLCGKVSLEQLALVSSLVEQGYFNAPSFISPALRRPASIDPVLEFIAGTLK